MVRLRQAAQSESLLALWNPGSNAIANLTSVEPQLFQSGVGAMARSGDHAKLIVGASDSVAACKLAQRLPSAASLPPSLSKTPARSP